MAKTFKSFDNRTTATHGVDPEFQEELAILSDAHHFHADLHIDTRVDETRKHNPTPTTKQLIMTLNCSPEMKTRSIFSSPSAARNHS